MSETPELWVARLGTVDYDRATAIQERIRERRQANEIPDCLLLLEHPPVYTRGRRTEPQDLPMGDEWYEAQGIQVRDADRGGRVTYHGPGQLVGYPICRVAPGDATASEGGEMDVIGFVRALERAMTGALADEGIESEVREGLTGVWVGERKIGSIGIHVARGVTTHGLAINVDCDLQPFSWVVPCGIEGVRMTSVAVETGRTGRMACMQKRVAHRIAEVTGRRQRLVSLSRLAGLPVGAAAGGRPLESVA